MGADDSDTVSLTPNHVCSLQPVVIASASLLFCEAFFEAQACLVPVQRFDGGYFALLQGSRYKT